MDYRRKFALVTQNNDKLPIVHVSQATLPIKLEDGWNKLEIDLQSLCKNTYNVDFNSLHRIKIYSNCYLRRVYLVDRHYEDDEMPIELCQAFFDMYMLKWGIHQVERASQTEEYRKGTIFLYVKLFF